MYISGTPSPGRVFPLAGCLRGPLDSIQALLQELLLGCTILLRLLEDALAPLGPLRWGYLSEQQRCASSPSSRLSPSFLSLRARVVGLLGRPDYRGSLRNKCRPLPLACRTASCRVWAGRWTTRAPCRPERRSSRRWRRGVHSPGFAEWLGSCVSIRSGGKSRARRRHHV